MDDAQVPPEAGDAKNTAARRSGTRLSDAEAVATTRLDMFGDNSLEEQLAGAPPGVPGDAESSIAPPEERVDDDQLLSASPLDDEAQRANPDLSAGDPAARPATPPSTDLESLDAAIDAAIDAADAPRAARDPGHASPGAPSPPSAGSAEREGAAEAERNGEPPATGPFGSLFMMPPGSGQGEQADLSGPLNEQPRFREEFIRTAPGDAVATGSEEPMVLPAATDAQEPPIDGPAEEPAFTETPAAPAEELPGAPTFTELSGASVYPEEGSAFHDPAAVPPEPEPPLAAPFLDVAAKIAAEANATAQVLDNLRRLLESKVPDLERAEPAGFPADRPEEGAVSSPPLSGGFRMQMHPDPSAFLGTATAPLLPLPVPPARSSSRGVYVLGFLTGLGLSLMAGAVLYFFINTG